MKECICEQVQFNNDGKLLPTEAVSLNANVFFSIDRLDSGEVEGCLQVGCIECESVIYIHVNNCPFCGRKLKEE